MSDATPATAAPGAVARKRKPFWRSHKVWAAALAAAVPILNRLLKIELSPTEVAEAMAPFLALIGVEGGADLAKVWHEAKRANA